jgi:peptidoglycan hydrolase CwlO-like protein
MVQIGSAWNAVKWWIERRDARSALATAKIDAEKTVKTLTETIATKNSEIASLKEEHDRDRQEWRAERHDLSARISHLESLAFGRGAS